MDEREFAEIVKRTKRIVLSAIEKNMSPRFYHAIDDVAQETYLRAFRGLEKNSFRGDSSIETWLYAIARNESLRMNGKLSREEEKTRKMIEARIEEPTASEEQDDNTFLQRQIALLPEKYRSVLGMAARGLSIEVISKNLGIKPGTVKSRTSRGKKMIQDSVRGEGHEEID